MQRANPRSHSIITHQAIRDGNSTCGKGPIEAIDRFNDGWYDRAHPFHPDPRAKTGS
jgi:hypothetical protein